MTKVQLTTAILFASILLSCKKENLNTDEPVNEKVKTANKLLPYQERGPITVTLPNVTVHPDYTFTFDWEWSATVTKDGGHYIASNFHSAGAAPVGYQHSWTQVQVMWVNDKSNPNVIHFWIKATDNFYTISRWPGVDHVEADMILFVSYDVFSHVYTVTVNTTGSHFINK